MAGIPCVIDCMKRLEECGAYERQFADVGGKGPRRLFDEIWRENDFDWQWEIDKGSEAFGRFWYAARDVLFPESDYWICCMGMKISRMLRIICA